MSTKWQFFSADNFFEKNNIGLKRFNIPIRTIVNDYQKQGVDTFFKHSKGKGKNVYCLSLSN